VNVLIVSPAYGKDYKSAAAALEAWNAGVDFKSHSLTVPGTYVSVRDIPGSGIDTVNIRYNRMERVAVWHADLTVIDSVESEPME